jgi:Mrp family chromosome partitioning ATPase
MRLRASTRASAGGIDFHADRPVGRVFEELGVLDPREVDRIRERQEETGASFTDAGKELGLLDQQMIDRALTQRREVARVDWKEHRELAPLDDAAQPASPYARELRQLLASLAKGQAVQRTPQRMVVAGVNTSTEASTVAASLATTCAGSGFRALLVDGNIDQPGVHRYFGVSNEVGLTSFLASSEPPHRFVQSTAIPNLAVITAGPRLTNYSSLISRERVFHRLQPIANSFEYIIADCSTLTPSLIGRLSAGADSVVVAVKEHVSSMRELSNMVQTLQAESAAAPSVLMIE